MIYDVQYYDVNIAAHVQKVREQLATSGWQIFDTIQQPFQIKIKAKDQLFTVIQASSKQLAANR